MEILKNIEIEGRHGKPILTDVFYKESREPKPVVIFSHGFKGFKDWGAYNLLAQYFANKKFIFVKFNFSHNGISHKQPGEFDDLEAFGKNNFEIEMDDLGSVIDWVTETPLVPEHQKNPNEIYLIGHSRGGGISILKAAEDNRVKKLAIWASVNDFGAKWDELFVERWKKDGVIQILNTRTHQKMPLYYQLYENYHLHHERFDIRAAVEKLKIPFLAVQGTEDQSVSMEIGLELKRWNQRIKLDLIPNADHTFGVKHPYNSLNLPFDAQIVWEHTLDFLK